MTSSWDFPPDHCQPVGLTPLCRSNTMWEMCSSEAVEKGNFSIFKFSLIQEELDRILENKILHSYVYARACTCVYMSTRNQTQDSISEIHP